MSGIGSSASAASAAQAAQTGAQQSAAEARFEGDDAALAQAQAIALSLREAQLSERKAMLTVMLGADDNVKTLDIQMNCISAFNEGEKASFSVAPENLDTLLSYSNPERATLDEIKGLTNAVVVFQQDGVEPVYRKITGVTKAADQQICIGGGQYMTQTGAYIFSLEGEAKVSAAFDRAKATATIAWAQG